MKRPQWRLLPADEPSVENLHGALGLHPLVCRLLVQRGLSDPNAIPPFFNPSLAGLHDPFLMRDMDRAVERLDRALQNGERILLYGDYDVDGTTSVALLYTFLSGFYRNLDYYLPDRDREGYGVSIDGVEYARSTRCSLVVALDCGIKGHAAVDLARSYGIDFIICDHHVPEGSLPEAVACLDPKRPDCPYPYKELSGCGIAFKLAQAMALHTNTPAEEVEHLLDLVAVSIACDIVPLTGENRLLAHFGLQILNRSPRTGLWALKDCIKRAYPLQVSDLVFAIGPLINAAGRLGDARDAVRLLLSADRASAQDGAAQLATRNRQRREVDYALADAARRHFTGQSGWEDRRSIVLFDPDWHKGVIGIAASRMAEAFHRPSVILTRSDDRAVGSARSVPGFDLYAALQQCEDLFHSYGGHAHAAGMQLPVENVPLFAERFESLVTSGLSVAAAVPVLELSARLELHEITSGLWNAVKRFAPFGPGNHNPLFWAAGLVDTGHSRLLANNHVRFSLRHAAGPGRPVFTGIGFGLGETFAALRHQPFDIAFNLREEHWQGATTLNLLVKDLKESEHG
jgi:single-stranded-DNA-specific exonuclease